MTGREKALVAAMAATALGAGAWTWGWKPLVEGRAAARAAIAEARTLADALDAWPAAAPVPDAAPVTPLTTRVTRSADGAGIALARIERGPAGITVTVEAAPFDALTGWIAALEADHGARLAAIALDRLASPGTVSARLELEDAP